MPLSLKLPEGFMPSYCKCSRSGLTPRNGRPPATTCSSVCPSPTVTHCSTGINGSRLWKRHTPLKQCGSLRRAHLSSKTLPRPRRTDLGQSYATSKQAAATWQATRTSQMS